MRIADLARQAGLSVQQIRNYADEGLLPPVERTPSGYRIFTARHAAALTTVRALAEGHGWDRTRTIMRAVHAADLDKALATVDAGHAELDRERAQITAVLGAFDSLVAVPSDRPGRPLRIGAVARALGVRPSALRLWEERGLLRPIRQPGTAYRLYDPAEVRNARIVALLRKGNYPVAIVEAVMTELRTTGSPGRVRAELYRREQDLRRRSLARLRATAALSAYLAAEP